MGSVTVDQKHVATEPKRGKTGKTKTEKCMVNERENSFQHRAVCSSCAPLPIYIGSQYEKFYIPLHTLKSSEHFSQDSIQCCEKPKNFSTISFAVWLCHKPTSSSHSCGRMWPTLLYKFASVHWLAGIHLCTGLFRSHHNISIRLTLAYREVDLMSPDYPGSVTVKRA